MDVQTVSTLIALVAIVSVAVWRFTKVETTLKRMVQKVEHQHECQAMLAKEVGRINMNMKLFKAILVRHIKGREAE